MEERLSSASVHEPFTDECTTCHDPHGGATGEGSLVSPVPALCFDCHDGSSADLRSRHQGISLSGADCSACHDPHASQGSALMHEIVHPPYDEGDCASCHDAGTGAVPVAETGLCLECHPGFGEDLREGVLHAPLEEDASCTTCHQPHAARYESLLARSPDGTCAKCHGEVRDAFASADHFHPALEKGTCVICHDPHLVSLEDGTSIAEQSCRKCHSFKDHVMHPMGGDVEDPRTGGPLNCLSCHSPHGSAQEYFLTDDPKGRLCVACHTGKIRAR
jgi:predicted CXXCH cytochrome family protein